MSASLIAVFIPILLMGGIVGRLFREFSVTLSVAVAVSMVVSLTTTPMMCAHLLRPRGGGAARRLYRASERAFDALLHALRPQPDLDAAALAAHARDCVAVTVAVNVALYVAIPKGFFPQQDTGMLAGTVQAPQDTSYHALSAMMTDFVAHASDGSGDRHASSRSPAAAGPARTRRGCSSRSSRWRCRKEHADAVIARLRRRFAREPRASLFFQAVQDIRVGGRAANAQYQFTLQADNLDDLNHWAPLLTARLRQTPVLADVSSDQENRGLQTTIAIDRDAAARLGVPARCDRRGALRRLRAAAGLDDLHLAESVSRRDGGGARVPASVRRGSSRSTCGRRRAASYRSARSPPINRTPRRCR